MTGEALLALKEEQERRYKAERIKAYQQKYRKENKDRLNARSRAYYAKNKPYFKQYGEQYRAAHRTELNQKRRVCIIESIEQKQRADIYVRDETALDATIFTVYSLAERWGVKPNKVYLMVEGGQIPSFRIGRSIRIRLQDILDFESKK